MGGPFEYLHGDLLKLSDEQIRIHYGFWRDDPEFNPIGICKANGNTKVVDKKCKMVHPIASNLFYFVQELIAMSLKDNNVKKEKIECIQESLNEFVQKNKIKLIAKNKVKSFKDRKKRIVSPTFNGFGLVVPVIDDIGYREIGYSERELKRILKRMNGDKKKKNKKVDASEMEIILTNICLADDEGDPGMGYELGIDFFFSYPMFAKHAKRLLMNAYSLTNRDSLAKILNAHFNVRAKQNDNYQYNQLLYTEKKNKKNKNCDNKNKEEQKITNFFKKNVD